MKSLCPNCYKSVESNYSRPDICPFCHKSFVSAFASTEDEEEVEVTPVAKKVIKGKVTLKRKIVPIEETEEEDVEVSPDDFKWEIASNNLPNGQKMVRYTLEDWAKGAEPQHRAPGNVSKEEALHALRATAGRGEAITIGEEGE